MAWADSVFWIRPQTPRSWGTQVLKLVVFLGGATLMALEIVGSRVLAPRFGSSIFVWGSLISIFLTALSFGYYWGGALADKRPRLSVLGGMMILPGVWIGLIPFFAPAVSDWVVSLSLGPRFSPLVASLILFAPPSIFLGTISPYAVRLEVRSVESAGNTAGRLYALSTAGSIAGTLLASFLLIPSMGVRNILHTLGLVLLLLAAGALTAALRSPLQPVASGTASLSSRSRRAAGSSQARVVRVGLIVLALLAALAIGASTRINLSSRDILYQKDSLYHRIIVEDHGWVRHLHFDNSSQSAMNLDDPYEQVFQYTRYLHLFRLFNPDVERALFVGLGGGSAPKRFLRDYPEMAIDVVELDPEVIYVAGEYFGLPEDERLRVANRDGRLFLREAEAVYDLIVLDAFFGETIPFHLTTEEFLERVAERLSPDGVVVANIIGSMVGPNSRLFRAMLHTYKAVFPQVYVFPVGSTQGPLATVRRNIILVATAFEWRLSLDELRARAADQPGSRPESPDLLIDVRPYLASLVTDEIPTSDVPLLTDDYAPVDRLQHLW